MLRSRRVLLFAVLCSLGLIVAACTSGKHRSPQPTATPSSSSTASSSAPASPAAQVPANLDFSDCSDQFQTAINTAAAKRMTFSCGKLAVPLSYADPTGKTIQLFVLKVHAKSQKPADKLGSLLVNPGGPGESGINLAAGLVSALSSDIFAHFDLIGFDPRGVGLSSPLECLSDQEKDQLVAADPDVRTAAGRAAVKAAATKVATDCSRKYGPALADYNTVETAEDMDVIRRAVGDDKLNYLGFSYGTRLGAAYAHEFPTNIRTEVLDGALDPGTSFVDFLAQQTKSLEAAFDQFATDCLHRPACAKLRNPRAAVQSLIASADRTPIPSSRKGETRRATGGVVTLAVVAALYDQSQWVPLGNALLQAERGDSSGLFSLADAYNNRDPATGHYTNVLDAETAINCNDTTFRPTDSMVASTARQWVSKYPLFGKSSAASLYECFDWPESGHPLPPAAAPGAPPILVVGTVHDPITPYPQATALAKALGTGVVLSWAGEGHTAYPKTSCIRTKVDGYLLTAKPPAVDSCPLS